MSATEIPGTPDDVVRVFVSYAREDRRWLDREYRFSLIPFLMESLRRHNVAFWFDKELKPGDEFRRFIESEIDQSQIALLIVSQNFLNSEFIENREMPRIAERARLGKMIVVPVLVEPCDWSEYPFLADRQMVPSSPLIDYTESDPQWVKVRFQILDGLKAQLKRIREAARSTAQKAQVSAPEEILAASATAAAALEMPAAIPEIIYALEDDADPLKQKQEVREPELVLQPSTPTGAISDGRTTISTAVEQKKTRNPRRRMFAIALGAVLVIALVLLAIFTSREKPWTARSSGTTQPLISIFGTSDGKRLWAVGERGTIIESDDEGATWVARNSGVTEDLTSIFGTSDGQRLWAVGSRGSILESDEGGVSWTARNSGTAQSLISIFGTVDGKHLWAVGGAGTIVESDDGGATWTARDSGTAKILLSIWGTGGGKRLWTVGAGDSILESDDGGATWTACMRGTPNSLFSILGTSDGRRLWAVGAEGTILESEDSGANWTAHNSRTSDYLHSIFGTRDGGRLWAVGLEGTIVESVDGGATWTARQSGTTQDLISIFGTDNGRHLWAVGDKGTILESGRW